MDGLKQWIETATHKKFSITEPRAKDVYLEDIASHLSRLQRFAGAGQVEYCVAEHCIHASRLADSPRLALALLLHDAHEAYLTDIPGPVKRALKAVAGEDVVGILERRVDRAIEEKLGFSFFLETHHTEIKYIDIALLEAEALTIVNTPFIKEWGLPEIPEKYLIEPDAFNGMRFSFLSSTQRSYRGQPYQEYCRDRYIREYEKLIKRIRRDEGGEAYKAS